MPRIDFGNNRGENLADPKYDKDAVNYRTQRRSLSRLGDQYLALTGGTMFGDVTFSGTSALSLSAGTFSMSGGTFTTFGGDMTISGGDLSLSIGDIYMSGGTGYIISPYIPHTAGSGNYVAVHTPNTGPGGGGLLASSATLLSACINPSDRNLKKNIEIVENSNSILNVEPVYFEWKDNEGQVNTGINLGVVAQQVEEHVPNAVWKNGEGILHIDNLALTSMLIHQVKEKDKEIKDLKSRLEAIEKKLGLKK